MWHRLSMWRTCLPDREREKDKEANTSYDEPKRHIVLSGKRDIVGVEGKTDMSEDYEKFHEIPPFKVKADPSILINDEDYPWLRRNKQMTQAKKKWRLSPATIMMIPCQLCNRRVWYHCPFCTRSASSFCRNPLNFLAHAMWMKWWYHANFQPFQSSFEMLFNFRVL